MTKTILDAVKHYRGVAIHDGVANPIWYNCVSYNDRNGFYLTQYRTKHYLCSRMTFNWCVEDLATNYGKCSQSYAEYKSDYGSIQLSDEREKETKVEYLIGQEMSLDGWNEINGSYSDGVTYRCVSGDSPNDPNAVFITGKEYTANGTGVVDEYDVGSKTSVCRTGSSSILKLISVPQPKPMLNNVGTVEFKGLVYEMNKLYACAETGRIGTLKGFDLSKDHPFVILHQERQFTTSIPCMGLVKLSREAGSITEAPIELIDGKAYQFESKSKGEAIVVEGVYSDSGSVFITVHGSFPKAVCTNIQPLTVANK